MLTRREFFRLTAGGMAAIALSDCTTEQAETMNALPLPADRTWLTLLTKGMDREYDYAAQVEGIYRFSTAGRKRSSMQHLDSFPYRPARRPCHPFPAGRFPNLLDLAAARPRTGRFQ